MSSNLFVGTMCEYCEDYEEDVEERLCQCGAPSWGTSCVLATELQGLSDEEAECDCCPECAHECALNL